MGCKDEDNNNVKNFAYEWVVRLQTEGSEIKCEDENDNYDDVLPPFFDLEKFRKGQQFFRDNIFALFYSKMLGLMTILSVPTILKMLIFTRMSGDAFSAFKRYLSTLFHMNIWYTSDFSPGSKLWESVREVRNKHNSASRRGCRIGLNKISQRDMAVTQFGFMGFALSRSKEIGLYEYKDDELEGFIHLWRVIGYIMGIEDRFNICTGSIAETKAICEMLISQELAPAFRNNGKEFKTMSTALCDGLWCINPFLKASIFSALIAKLLRVHGMMDNNNKENTFNVDNSLTFWEKVHLVFVTCTIKLLQFRAFKIWRNGQMRMDFWLMKNFPFLAYYKFGYGNSHVRVLERTAA